MSTIRKSPDGRSYVITPSPEQVAADAKREMELAAATAVQAQAASERLDAKLKARNEGGGGRPTTISVSELERTEREAKAKIASIESWNAYTERLEASGKALAAWEANKGKRKARISQWVLGIK